MDSIRAHLNRYGIYSYHLEFSEDIQKQLSVLNLNLSLTEKLLFLDRSIYRKEFRWQNHLFIIRSFDLDLFIVIFQTGLDNLSILLRREISPMMIYRVNQIHKIIRPGFFHRNAYQFVPWPFESDGYEITASRWLHNNLIKISQVYRSR